MVASTIPVTMQMSQAGKKDPTILKDGARAQPARALRLPNAPIDAIVLCESCTSFWSFPFSKSVMVLPSVAVLRSGRPSQKQDWPSATAAECARRHLPISPARESSAQRLHRADFALHSYMTLEPPHTTGPRQ